MPLPVPRRPLTKIADQEIGEHVFATIHRFRDRVGSFRRDDSMRRSWSSFADLAPSMGFQVDNPQDDLSRLVAISLRDFNPERVVRDCRHLIVLPSRSLGMTSRLIGLPFAGQKTIRRMLHESEAGGWSLDQVYAGLGGPGPLSGFKFRHCDSCPDREARDQSWRWTIRWHRDEIWRPESDAW